MKGSSKRVAGSPAGVLVRALACWLLFLMPFAYEMSLQFCSHISSIANKNKNYGNSNCTLSPCARYSDAGRDTTHTHPLSAPASRLLGGSWRRLQLNADFGTEIIENTCLGFVDSNGSNNNNKEHTLSGQKPSWLHCRPHRSL